MTENLLQDLRFGFRALCKDPTFAVVAVFTLALGIGANTAIFSVVNAVLLQVLPYRDPNRIVMVWETNLQQSKHHEESSPGNFLDWAAQNKVFGGITAWMISPQPLQDDHHPEVVTAARVLADFFPVLGVEAAIGRTFLPEEVASAFYSRGQGGKFMGKHPVVVISHALWRRHFGSDPGIIGRAVSFNGERWQVIGVMPASFAFPNKEVDLWIPWDMARGYAQRFPNGPPRDWHFLSVVARLKTGVTLEEAQANMNVIAARLEQQYPESNKGWGIRLVPLHEEMVGSARQALFIMFGAVGFVLLIACANVANLLLARSSGRGREMAIRAALGASRPRVVRQMLTESLLLALAGAASGLVLSYWVISLLVAISPSFVPRIPEVELDARVLLFTLGLTVITGLIFGLAPALQASRVDVAEMLKGGRTEALAGGIRRRHFRNLLVAAEVAIALVLLAGAGLLARSFIRIRAVNPGFDPENILIVNTYLDVRAYYEGARVVDYYHRLIERLETLPSVVSAGAVSGLPMSEVTNTLDSAYCREGDPLPPVSEAPKVGFRITLPGYFKSIGIPLLRGRDFTKQDQLNPARVIINQTLAQRLWPDQEPLGKGLLISFEQWQRYEVIGVVGDTRFYGLKHEPRPEAFVPISPDLAYRSMKATIRTAADPAGLVNAVRQGVLAVDPTQPAQSIVSMEQIVSASVAPDRALMSLLGLLSLLALILASMGIYGVTSYFITQRSHEIGIRMALGAKSVDVFRLIVGQGMVWVLIGIAIGLGLAFALTHILSSLLFQVSATDTLTFAGVALLIAAAALLACYLPARRATKIDSMITLRCE